MPFLSLFICDEEDGSRLCAWKTWVIYSDDAPLALYIHSRTKEEEEEEEGGGGGINFGGKKLKFPPPFGGGGVVFGKHI